MSDEVKKEEQPAAPPVAKIISPVDREKVVPLTYPVEFNGTVYSSITVRRVTGKEVKDYLDKIGVEAFTLPPTIDCPFEVWEAMDADDQLVVDEAAMAFMPRRLKVAVEQILKSGALSSD